VFDGGSAFCEIPRVRSGRQMRNEPDGNINRLIDRYYFAINNEIWFLHFHAALERFACPANQPRI